jgi:hypothetical protein
MEFFMAQQKNHAANETDPCQSCERAVQGPAHRYPRRKTRVEPLVTSSGFNRQKRTTICEVIVPKPWVFYMFLPNKWPKRQTWIPDFFGFGAHLKIRHGTKLIGGFNLTILSH